MRRRILHCALQQLRVIGAATPPLHKPSPKAVRLADARMRILKRLLDVA